MSEHAPGAPRLAVGLTGAQVLEAISRPELWRRLRDAGIAFAVAGIDRLAAASARPTTPTAIDVDDSIAAAYLAGGIDPDEDGAVLIAAAAHRDHPYNLARRVASADHLSRGRTGLLIGGRDRFAPAAESGREAWSGARLAPGAPLEAATTRDAAEAVAALWLSWPVETIVADRATGVYARADGIIRVDHRGVFDVAGPLTVPTTPQTAPVLAWYAADAAELAAADGVAELVIAPAEVIAGRSVDVPVFVEAQLTVDGDAAAALDTLGASGHDVLLRADLSLAEFVRRVDEARDARLIRTTQGGTLRARLGLDGPRPLDVDRGTPAFTAASALR